MDAMSANVLARVFSQRPTNMAEVSFLYSVRPVEQEVSSADGALATLIRLPAVAATETSRIEIPPKARGGLLSLYQ